MNQTKIYKQCGNVLIVSLERKFVANFYMSISKIKNAQKMLESDDEEEETFVSFEEQKVYKKSSTKYRKAQI